MEPAEYSRMLGEVQGSLTSLRESLDRVLDNQESARIEVIQVAGKVSAKLEEHALADQKDFASIRDGIGGLRDRIARLELIPDTVDSHGDAILSIEKRLSEDATFERTLQTAQEINRRWQKGLVGAAGIAAGAMGTHAPAVLKWLAALGR